ncbi:MAG: hypothetical protein OHK0048_20640 [Rhodoferax sp.]
MPPPSQPSAPEDDSAQREDALRYAALLSGFTRVGLWVLLLGFAAYALGWTPAWVAPSALPELWSKPLAEYLAQSKAPVGWAWLAYLGRGDMLNLLGIAILAGASVPPLLGLLLLYLRRRDWLYAGLCAALVGVLMLAASGVLNGGR